MKNKLIGGGWPAVAYTWQKAREVGGISSLWRAMRTRNSCKTCALGMGGQAGGMVNEAGRFPEVCKKAIQAMAADMQPHVPSDFWSRHSRERLRVLSSRELEYAGRLTEPVRYAEESGRFEPISWDESLEKISMGLRRIQPDESFWYFSGRASNEAGFLLQLFARIYGTNNVNNCSYYCHQPSGVGLKSVLGTGTATLVLEDLESADLVFVVGANPASNHPRLMRSLLGVRRRGGEVIVVNPVREAGLEKFRVPSDPRSMMSGGRIASMVIQPDIGGDLALFTGIAKRILEIEAHDEAFLTKSCAGWQELRTSLERAAWDEIVAKSGVSRRDIDAVASRYAAARRVIFSWAMGITHHTHGVENVQAIANLALIRGMVGRPGCGMMPIRGHSNVQGVGSVGVTPVLSQAIFERLRNELGFELPTTVGRDTMACMEGAAEGRLKFGFCLGGNLFGSNPDSGFASKSLSNLDQLVYLNTTLNTGHAWALARETFILPVKARDEEPQATTQESMFNYVRLSDGGPARHAGPRSEIEVITALAERVLGNTSPVDWPSMRSTSRLRELIGLTIPGYGAIADIDRTKHEFQIDGRTFHEPRFPTADGRARLHTLEIPDAPDYGENEISLMTIRSEGQFNTVVYEEYDLYRGVEGRDIILLHPDDLSRLNLLDGDTVRVVGPGGAMAGIRAVSFDRIKTGNGAMYFPEANRLLDRTVDRRARTPAFKAARVRIEKP